MYKKYFLVDHAKLEYLRTKKGWSVDDIQLESEALLERELAAKGPGYSPPKLRGGKRDSKVTRGTIFKIDQGKPVLLETARVLASLFGLKDVSLILAKGELPPIGPPETWGDHGGHFSSLTDWEPDQLLGVLPRKPHGIESELWKVRHRFVPGRFARGKVYLTDTLSTVERNRIREYLVRHADVCNRLSRTPGFPRNITCSPDSNNQTWWVVDEWIDGETLEDRLAAGRLNLREAARILKELAAALHALHENRIVRRDLSPEDMLLREADESVVLTDFELSKVLDGRPTVAPADWREYENRLRAPEVGSPDSTVPAVDLYSWGKLFALLVNGEYPSDSTKPTFSEKFDIPRALGELVASCIAVNRRNRPESFIPVIAALEKWKPK